MNFFASDAFFVSGATEAFLGSPAEVFTLTVSRLELSWVLGDFLGLSVEVVRGFDGYST